MKTKSSILGALAATLMATSAAFAGDVRIMWYSDGVEGDVIKDILDRFQKDNPDIKITLDNVAYKVVQEQLPIQLEAGQGPDIARVTNIKELANHWLDMRPHAPTPNIGTTISARRWTGCGPTVPTPSPAS
jgi:alpha-1,4-digalacturonate transport system substrate-binding protein